MGAVEETILAWRGGTLRNALGKIIRQGRRAKKLSQAELGSASGLARNYISRLELGDSSPTVDSLSRIARALDEPVSSLLARAEGLQLDRSGGRRRR
jgi:transcriptional regulator with XRE-family HTH domain